MFRKKQSVNNPDFPLENTIDELESLIADKNLQEDNIPVLDDVVDPDYFDEHEVLEDEIYLESIEDSDNNQLSADQIELLAGKMNQRISGELDELVNLLKDAIKDSIITEIKSLESEVRKKPGDNDPQNS